MINGDSKIRNMECIGVCVDKDTLNMMKLGSRNKTLSGIKTLRRPKIRILIVYIPDAKPSGIKFLEEQ